MYSSWGDGRGFDLDSEFVDVGVARIEGNNPAKLTGKNTATADSVVKRWASEGVTRKPTGMVCVGNTLYLAVQDLAGNFNQAEKATIVKSTDGGHTWTYDHRKPMFSDHQFTTVWFADFGRGGQWNTTKYVYAYGIDGNWRNSTTDDVPDPQDVYLARVPKKQVQKRDKWQFFSGFSRDGVTPTWSKSIIDRTSVLYDGRRDIPRSFVNADWQNTSIISQGGVTYDKPLNRYLYTSWSEWEHHFYESPTPWGPWTRLFDHNYTIYPKPGKQYAGYGTTISDSLDRVSRYYDVMIVEGSGSPVECGPLGRLANEWVIDQTRLPVAILTDARSGAPISNARSVVAALSPSTVCRLRGMVISRMVGTFVEDPTRSETSALPPTVASISLLGGDIGPHVTAAVRTHAVADGGSANSAWFDVVAEVVRSGFVPGWSIEHLIDGNDVNTWI